MAVTPRNRVVSRLPGKPFLTVASERHKVLFFFRVTFEGRNARGITVLLSFVSRSSLFLYSKYAVDSGDYVKRYDSNSAKRLLLARKRDDISSLARVVTLQMSH